MSEYMFGVAHDRPSRKAARKMNTVAKKHGAYLVEANIPGTGYQRWFCGPNRGEPFDSAMAKAVLADIAKLEAVTQLAAPLASIQYARVWARIAAPGDYLIDWNETGLTHDEDPGSRGGFDDRELAEIRNILRGRDLTLTADDRGLLAEVCA